MAHEVAVFPPSIDSKEGSFGSNNSNEPISVLDTRRSPSPSTSISNLSSSFGGGAANNNAATVGVSDNNIQQNWPEYSVPLEMGVSGSLANLATIAGGCRKDEWSELQPISAEFEPQQKRFGVGLDDWERLLSESGGSQVQDQDQSLLRWISGDVDDTSFSLKQLLQGNQIDENAPPTTVFKSSSPPQLPSFFPFLYPGQNPQNFNSQMIVNPPSQQPQPPPPPLEIQFHQSSLQKPPAFDQSHEFLLKKQNQLLSLHQQRSMMAVVAKQEPLSPPGAAPPPPHYHQKQLICDPLYAAAELMLSGNFSHAQGILARLNHQLPSAMAPYKPIERSGFYFKEALQMQMAFLISKCNPTSLPRRVVPSPSNGMFKMCAYKVLSEVSPIIQFMNFTSNQALLEALDDADNIHIIDFDIGFGAQWASFIQELPRRTNTNGGGCSLKITAFASPSTHHPVELGLMHENLSQFAQEIGISFELEVVNFDSFDPNSFLVSGKAAVGVNFPIWSTSTHLAAIPSLLHFIKQLSPKIVVSLDRGCERTDLTFPQYLMEGLQYYEALLESIGAANIPSYTANKIEKFLLQPQIESMVMGKVEFPEPMAHWKTLFTAGGYLAVGLSNFAEAQADCVVKRSEVRGFDVEKRHGSLVLCWKKRELMAVSAWKC
ncbi:scarecrow-like protein 6 [Cynara cardunculus var. scolymus]|nr:scarecrow-like protein 6 [Cynara cardunculus var. scolymus]